MCLNLRPGPSKRRKWGTCRPEVTFRSWNFLCLNRIRPKSFQTSDILAFAFNFLAKEGLTCPSLVPSWVHFGSKTVEVGLNFPHTGWRKKVDRCPELLISLNCSGKVQRGPWKGSSHTCPCIKHLGVPQGLVGWGWFLDGTESCPQASRGERHLWLCWDSSWCSWQNSVLSRRDWDSNPDLGDVQELFWASLPSSWKWR